MMSIYDAIKARIIDGVFGEADLECVQKLTAWIMDGTLDDAWNTDKKEVIACVVSSIGVLLSAIGNWLHDGDEDTPVFGSVDQQTQADAYVAEMGQSLGVYPAMSGGAINNVFWQLVLQALLKYLAEYLGRKN